MDLYDPQTLGIMVFGGFMVISALGIALVSTFSMKETSYEEALAKQRRELGKIQSTRTDKKKKEKATEKKSRGKKKEEKPNGKIPEPEKSQEESEADSESAVAPVVEPEPEVEPQAPAAEPAPEEPSPSTPAPEAAKPAQAPPTKSSAAPAPVKTTQAPAATKSAPAPAKTAPAQSKPAPVLETVTKDVPVMAVPPVGSQPAPAANAKPQQEPKKKASKKKSEPASAVDSTDAPLYLPYKTLVSTISSMVFSEGEAHRLIEILSEKAGIIQDSWHMATQKGDPVAMLKKQLEEREKQLAAEQEDASAAKNRLRELTKELSAEKSKVASVETRLSSQLSKREQEMIALQARMQASYQDHLAQTQRLNAKVLSLRDQLDKGPNAQLARLQQENTILRDALNQATSQAESKQNAELAKLRQECTKLTKELGEKNESLLADEHIRKGLEAKVSATEKQLAVMQASHAESEQALQKRLEEVCEELRSTQGRNGSLQATLEQSQQDSGAVSELQARIRELESDNRDRAGQVEALGAQLNEAKSEKEQLEQKVASINSLLEATQSKEQVQSDQVNLFKMSCDRLEISLCLVQFYKAQRKHTQKYIYGRFNFNSNLTLQVNSEDVKQLRQRLFSHQIPFFSQVLLGKLKEAEESHTSLQTECEQYRTVLAETEGMLKHLQKSVEEEELVWKSKMEASGEQLKTVGLCVHVNLPTYWLSPVFLIMMKEQIALLEAQLERQSDNPDASEEVEQVQRKSLFISCQL
uniref:Ribosome binding protein 1a n=1 Tax=Neogobius melanostomus TaxID=47308 RepID=A0A8C6SAK2_9GOBI